MSGVSFVLPVHNGARHLDEVLDALLHQQVPPALEVEIIVVDDASRDASPSIIQARATRDGLRFIQGDGRGFSAAVNMGVRAARYPFIGQIDQDVVLKPGWLASVWAAASQSPRLGAVQGVYEAADDASLLARVMALDLLLRYEATNGTRTNHVCTGVTLYRRDALLEVGLFDEELGYANDNDMSYRLAAAGYELALCREARATHYWRETLSGYWRQQYGVGYGRLQLVAKHPHRVSGDQVSGPWMMLHAPLTLVALSCLVLGGIALAFGLPPMLQRAGILIGGGLLGLLLLERSWAGVRAWRTFRDASGVAFPLVHLVRNVAWSWAIVRWSCRRILRRSPRPTDSMPRS